ncbi:hypothetical protein C1N91_01015 [Curtobacterium sp. SGAir0471]|uniref:Dabb family protein n=1 Tax=Curtobacterium sp. SGAir0471 TaxID=2070337 RepID=UPI0010CCF51E|nr:Dabb family protein [Curtobacterium sp. SGAir0471]QCR42328.1 hypothetical protein C1N91_01015 [Curtobacterium sp. SGAir0471]
MAGVTHVVLVQWDAGQDGIGEHAARADDLCREHLSRIDGVESVHSGPSISTEGKEDGFDWMLTVRSRDREALAGYLPHPEHRPVADHIGAGSSNVVVFDVED